MTMSSAKWQRRTFLRALGAGALSLPFYRLLESSAVEGQDERSPLRLLLLYSQIGGRWESVRPRGIGDGPDVALTPESIDFEGSALGPLAPYASRMTVIEGLAMSSALVTIDGGVRTYYIGHEHTAANIYTGSFVDDGTADGGESSYLPRGPSLDQELAARFGDTVVRSIQIGVGGSAGRFHSETISYDGEGRRLPAVSNPLETFRTFFGDMPTEPSADIEAAARARRQRLAVVDALQRDAERLRDRLGALERTKLDAHLAALADIERQVGSTAVPRECSPVAPLSDPPFDEANIAERTRAQLATMAQAFACDRTRFASGTLGPFGMGGMTWLEADTTDLHNQVAHSVEGDTEAADLARTRMAQLNRWYATHLASFLDQLDAVPERDGSVLDNTLVVWMPDFGHDTHGGLNVPCVLLGGAQQRLRMGRYLNYYDRANDAHDWRSFEPNNKLLVSILQAFGVETNQFNSDEFEGALSGLNT
jgi:hypothetical protein